METELGYVAYDYVWSGGRYFRRRMFGLPDWHVYEGSWVSSEPPRD